MQHDFPLKPARAVFKQINALPRAQNSASTLNRHAQRYRGKGGFEVCGHIVRPFIVMDVLETAQAMERGGEDIIHLEVGEPDFDTPECIKAAGFRALHEGKTH